MSSTTSLVTKSARKTVRRRRKSFSKDLILLLFTFELIAISCSFAQPQFPSFLPSGKVFENPDDAKLYAQIPEDMEVHRGDRAILKCRSKNFEDKVQWTKNGFGMGYRDEIQLFDERYKMRGNDGYTWDLEINDVSLYDDDIYDCQIHGSKSPAAKLTVFVAPDQPYIEGGEVKKVIEKQEVELTCIAKEGKPAAEILWRDQVKRLINNVRYKTKRMTDSKLFEASSTIVITPTKEMHNSTFTCESWNRASAGPSIAKVRLEVLFAPSVSITPVKPGMAREGEKAGFRCSAVANPPPDSDKYEWFLDDQQISSQFGYYYEIFNISRKYQDRQLKCSVENKLGIAKGVRTIEVQYGPTFTIQPTTVADHEMETVLLRCAVDSNPPAKYYWTRGDSRKVIRSEQNLSLRLSRETVGVYFCHASVSDFPTATSRPAQVLMKAPPTISSPSVQEGEVGVDVQVNCIAISVPEPTQTLWKYHDKYLEEGNPHYRIINTPIQNGLRSTLIIRQSIASDFGTYTCHVKNQLGFAELQVELEQKRPFPIIPSMVGAFTVIIIVLVTTIFMILCRRRQTQRNKTKGVGSDAAATTNNLIAANNLRHEFTKESNLMKSEIDSNEGDSAWEGSDDNQHPEMVYGRLVENGMLTQRLLRDTEPDFPPKPDVISTGYVPYATYVRDFNPPFHEQDSNCSSSVYGTHQSLLNVSDPRYSATYGNPYLRQQMGPGTMQYSTFLPPTSSNSTLNTFQSNFPTTNHNTNVLNNNGYQLTTLPAEGSVTSSNSRPPSVPYQNGGIAASTPNSSVSNMACLPEENGAKNCANLTSICNLPPSPGPTPTPQPMTSLQSINNNRMSPRDSISNGQYVLPSTIRVNSPGNAGGPVGGGALATHV